MVRLWSHNSRNSGCRGRANPRGFFKRAEHSLMSGVLSEDSNQEPRVLVHLHSDGSQPSIQQSAADRHKRREAIANGPDALAVFRHTSPVMPK